jgi:hypothetical protein
MEFLAGNCYQVMNQENQTRPQLYTIYLRNGIPSRKIFLFFLFFLALEKFCSLYMGLE